MTNYFRAAPWSKILKATSAGATLVLAGVGLAVYKAAGGQFPVLIGVILLAELLIPVCFIVRGYSLENNRLVIHRPLWSNSFDLPSGSLAAKVDMEDLRGTWRLFANGGLFSFSGLFRNRKFGKFRVFATDFARLVMVDAGGRKVAVSPEDPEGFIAAFQTGPLQHKAAAV